MAFLRVKTQAENVNQNQEKNTTDQKWCELQNVSKLIKELNKRIHTTLFRNSIIDIGKEVIEIIVWIYITPPRTLEKGFYQQELRCDGKGLIRPGLTVLGVDW